MHRALEVNKKEEGGTRDKEKYSVGAVNLAPDCIMYSNFG
jgi:hypothetical protein